MFIDDEEAEYTARDREQEEVEERALIKLAWTGGNTPEAIEARDELARRKERKK